MAPHSTVCEHELKGVVIDQKDNLELRQADAEAIEAARAWVRRHRAGKTVRSLHRAVLREQ